MAKQIKLSSLHTGLKLSLSLVLISQLAVRANDNTQSDKTAWITNSIENCEQHRQKHSYVSLKAMSAQMDNGKNKSIVVSCPENPAHLVKLRPFMANRRLPSRKDFELALIEQRAQLAPENNAQLNGQVATFVSSVEAVPDTHLDQTYIQHITRARSRNNRIIQSASATPSMSNFYPKLTDEINSKKLAPAQLNAAPSTPQNTINSQQRFSFMQSAEQHMLTLLAPQTNANANQNMENLSVPQSPASVPDSFASSFASPAENAPSSLPMNPFLSSPSATDNSGYGAAGPPPFPLNLLPQPALKQLIRSMAMGGAHHNMGGPKAAFGSWHNGSTLSNYPAVSNLPPAGFQSHLQTVATRQRRKVSRYNLSAPPAVTRSTNRRSQNARAISNKNGMAITNRQAKVAVYPGYATQSLTSWNFAR